jgi:hypothetical protein
VRQTLTVEKSKKLKKLFFSPVLGMGKKGGLEGM